MPKMSMSVPHSLSQEEALTRIQGLLADMKAQHGDRISDLHEQWSGNGGTFSFRAMGFAISGSLNVKPSEVELRGEFPWAAKPFQGTIEQTIRERAEKLLS